MKLTNMPLPMRLPLKAICQSITLPLSDQLAGGRDRCFRLYFSSLSLSNAGQCLVV